MNIVSTSNYILNDLSLLVKHNIFMDPLSGDIRLLDTDRSGQDRTFSDDGPGVPGRQICLPAGGDFSLLFISHRVQERTILTVS